MKQYQFIFNARTENIDVRFLIIEEDFGKAKKEAATIAGIEFTDFSLESCKEMTPYTANETEKEE